MLARHRGCRIDRTADGHFKLYGPDGQFLGKLKAHGDRDRGHFRRRLIRRLQALPVPATTRAPVLASPPAVTLRSAPEVVGAGDVAADAMLMNVNAQPVSWLEWMVAEPRQGTRAVRRRRWRFERSSAGREDKEAHDE
jgi:hypothetical protein